MNAVKALDGFGDWREEAAVWFWFCFWGEGRRRARREVRRKGEREEERREEKRREEKTREEKREGGGSAFFLLFWNRYSCRVNEDMGGWMGGWNVGNASALVVIRVLY